ncbi:hypothetical protein GTA08_BOTSDO07859 [Neofusicoccum parvum]|uniref:Uncharacterized protein n=1 Tax=Neofusicoccum parvum TaxID=310453 RepID=A0ACB5SJW3_9PEZI|nr:hypothetical protein GTA08_BOTSDO07859 [Neofusicoccum parvum]GME59913.1 hypothetical protein GTA08_BOTSDO07859 [Neofusicoccum parvum]
MVIKPVGVPWKQNKRAIRFRLFGPSDLEMTISGPLGIKDRAYAMQDYYYRPEKSGLEFAYNTPEESTRPSDPENTYTPQLPTLLANRQSRQSNGSKLAAWPLPLEPLKRAESKHARKPSGDRRTPTYSLFPNQLPADDVPRLPATVYNPNQSSNTRKPSFDTGKRGTAASFAPSVTDVSEAYQGLLPPMPLFAQRPFHRRDSSVDSSATVQIGLRLSVAPAAMMAGSHATLTRPFAPPSPVREPTDSSGESIGLPIQAPAPAPLFSTKPFGHKRQQSSIASGPSGPPPSVPPPSMPSPLTMTMPQVDIQEEQKNEATPAALVVPAAPVSPASTRFQEDDESEDGSSQYSAPSFNSFTIINPQNSQNYLETARNKVLPPTPSDSLTDGGKKGEDENKGAAASPRSNSPLRMNPISTPERTASPRWVDLRSGTIKRSDSPAHSGKPVSPTQQWI